MAGRLENERGNLVLRIKKSVTQDFVKVRTHRNTNHGACKSRLMHRTQGESVFPIPSWHRIITEVLYGRHN